MGIVIPFPIHLARPPEKRQKKTRAARPTKKDRLERSVKKEAKETVIAAATALGRDRDREGSRQAAEAAIRRSKEPGTWEKLTRKPPSRLTADDAHAILEEAVFQALRRCHYDRGGLTVAERREDFEIRVMKTSADLDGFVVASYPEEPWIVPVPAYWLTEIQKVGLSIVAGRLVVGLGDKGYVYAVRQSRKDDGAVVVTLAEMVPASAARYRLRWVTTAERKLRRRR